jgi:hypothetical protein
MEKIMDPHKINFSGSEPRRGVSETADFCMWHMGLFFAGTRGRGGKEEGFCYL